MPDEDTRFSRIPAGACQFGGGTVEVGDNGDGARSVPVRLLARSAQPIEHGYWGRVVHDMAGMHQLRERGSIDYAHDDKEIVGYYNHHEAGPDGLMLSGALVPFKDSDRASEIAYKMANGVPYEASINFGGDGIRLQQLEDGESTEVNGFTFEGPGIVIRSWPLRNVAICPLGADANTSAVALSSGETFAAELMETHTMDENIPADAVDETPAEATEMAAVETEPEAAADELDTELSESDDDAETIMVDVIAISELERMVTEFGADTAVQAVLNGGGYEDALFAHVERLEAEVAELRAAKHTADSGETAGEFNIDPGVGDAVATEKARLMAKGYGSAMAGFMAAQTIRK